MQIRIARNKNVKGYRVVVGDRIYLAPARFQIVTLLVRYFDITVDEAMKLLERFDDIEMRVTLNERLQWKEL